MVPLTALWLPILLSTVLVFVASAIMHMVLTYHKSDFRKLPDEERVTDALRNAGVGPGRNTSFPYYSFEEMKSPAVIEKLKRGPVGFMTVLPSGPPAMGKSLFQWFVVLHCDQHLCRLSDRPDAGTGNRSSGRYFASSARSFSRLRRSPRPGLDLGRPKLGRHLQAHLRQPHLCGADSGSIRVAVAEIAVEENLRNQKQKEGTNENWRNCTGF